MSAIFERSRDEACLSDLAIDRLVARDLSPGEVDVARVHASSCVACAARIREIEEVKARFVIEPIARPLSRRARPRWIAIASAGGALAAAIALFAVLVPDPGMDGGSIRTKGGPALSFYVKHGERVRRGGRGEIVSPSDALRFAYSSDHEIWIAVLSVDPEKKASVYFPLTLEPPGREIALPLSTVLDDVLGKETIVGLFCEQKIDLDPRALVNGPAPDGCSVDRIAIEKRRRE